MSEQTKQDMVVELVKAGTFTRAEILEKVGCTPAGFASYLNAMRNAAKFTGQAICPLEKVVDDKKIMTVGTYDEFMANKAVAAAKPGKLPAKSAAEIWALAKKRVEKANVAYAKLSTAEKTEENKLRVKLAAAESNLAEYLFSQLPVPEAVDATELEVEAEAPAEDELV